MGLHSSKQAEIALDGLRTLPDSATITLMAAFNEAKDGNLDAVPGLLRTAAVNMETEGYGDSD